MTRRQLESAVRQVVNAVGAGAYRATKYLSPKLTVKATRRFARRRIDRRNPNVDIVLCIGRPNYAERQFIELCRKAGEAFPVRKVQLKLPRAA